MYIDSVSFTPLNHLFISLSKSSQGLYIKLCKQRQVRSELLLSYIILLVRISNTMLNKTGKENHSFFYYSSVDESLSHQLPSDAKLTLFDRRTMWPFLCRDKPEADTLLSDISLCSKIVITETIWSYIFPMQHTLLLLDLKFGYVFPKFCHCESGFSLSGSNNNMVMT